jgi:hypothetical protein
LEIARGYRLLARPGEGYVFSNWTGQVTGNLPALDFLMQSNMTVQANFVPNPFLRVGGTYNGLFFEATEVRHESSGDLRVRVTPSGKYSASVRLAGRRYSVSGQLDLEGKATNSVARTGTSSLTIRWAVNLQGLDEITGTISDGTWLAELRGDRLLFNATTNRTSLAGRYTFVLPGSLASGTPNADGWGTLKVSFAGAATAAGSLADGTRFSRKAPHSKHGSWPLYVPLYKLSGSLIGWVQFDTNAPLDDMGGLVDWFKPSQPDAGFYPAGFTNQSTLTGSRYLAPTNSTEPVLNMTTGVRPHTSRAAVSPDGARRRARTRRHREGPPSGALRPPRSAASAGDHDFPATSADRAPRAQFPSLPIGAQEQGPAQSMPRLRAIE